MKYLLLVLALLALLFSCTAETHNQPITYDHPNPNPKQLGKLLRDGNGLRSPDNLFATNWYFFENYLIVLSYEQDSLIEVEIDHRIENKVWLQVTDCCFDLINLREGERPDTCWWWTQLPNAIRDEISARKYKQ